MEQQKELQSHFRNQQEKYHYYIIALCTTAIGFSVVKTSGHSFHWSQIPLGVAVLSWAASIYCGINFIRLNLSTLYSNIMYFNVFGGKHPDVGSHPQNIEAATKDIMEGMVFNINKAKCLSRWQYRLLFLGFISFLIWHLIEMYAATF